MKERLFTFALAVGAFALFYALLAPKPAPPQELVTRPISAETGPNGYAAFFRWLQDEGVPTESLRERYGHLYERFGAASGTGHLLINTTPHLYPVRDSEFAPLRDWISAGNTLLVVAGLSDTPDWSMGEGYDADFLSNMAAMTSLTFEQIFAEEADQPENEQAVEHGESAAEEQEPGIPEPGIPETDTPETDIQQALSALQKLTTAERFSLVPNGEHPLLQGVESALAISEYPSAKWRAASDSSELLLELAHEPQSGAPALWLLQHGRGQIIVSAYGSLFTNKVLGEQDNARLLANIVTRTRSPNGRVIIDDAHQGLVSFYDPDAFFGDARLHTSLWWLIGLWLVFVLGPQRLRPSPSSWQPIDITSFVRATGGFLARVLKPAAAGRQLFANFFNDIRRQIGLPENGAPVWDWIHAHAAVSPSDIARLQRLHGKVTHGSRVDLTKLHNTLIRVRKNSL